MSALLEAELSGPEAYAASLYQRHHAAIFRYCLRQLRRREDADDAVQTTFIYALLSLRRGVMPELEAPWLFTIARNVCSTRRRSRTRRSELEAPQDLESLQDVISSPDRSSRASADDLRAALNTLPERQRKAMLLREWQGLSYNEIAAELGLSQQAIETLLFRARRNLAQRLDTAGVRALNGAWLLSLVRALFRSGGAKTAAVAIGAAATIAGMPSASEGVKQIEHKRPAAIVASNDVGRSTAPISPAKQPRRPSTRSTKPISAPPTSPATDTQTVETAANPDVTAAPPPSVVAPPAPPQQTAPAEQPTPAPVDVVSDVTKALPPLPGVELPEVKLPDVQVPPLPEVQLPTVTVPTLPG